MASGRPTHRSRTTWSVPIGHHARAGDQTVFAAGIFSLAADHFEIADLEALDVLDFDFSARE